MAAQPEKKTFMLSPLMLSDLLLGLPQQFALCLTVLYNLTTREEASSSVLVFCIFHPRCVVSLAIGSDQLVQVDSQEE